jgi:hypothetical protein
VLCALFAAQALASPAVTAPTGPVHGALGDAAHLRYEISWDDADGALAVLPPEVPTLPWGRAWVAESGSDGPGRAWLVVAVEADDAGEHAFPALRVPLAPAGLGISSVLDVTQVTPADAAAVTVVFSAPWRLGAVPGLVAGLAAVGAAAGGLWWWRRGAQARAAQAAGDALDAAGALLHAARRQRLDGDFYAHYKSLARAATLGGAAKLGGQLEEKSQSVGYRGVRPGDDEMDGDLRAVERALAGQREERHA